MGMVWEGLFWGWVAGEAALVAMTWTRKSRGAVSDRGSIQVFWVAIGAAISLGSWWADVHGRTMFGGAHWVRTASVWVMLAGLVIRWMAIWTLRRAFSVNVAIRTGQQLQRTGLYAVVRHPSYSGLVLVFGALGLRMQNWGAMAIVVGLPMAAMLYRLRVEEAALGQAFGAEYAEYCRTTKRLVPGIY